MKSNRMPIISTIPRTVPLPLAIVPSAVSIRVEKRANTIDTNRAVVVRTPRTDESSGRTSREITAEKAHCTTSTPNKRCTSSKFSRLFPSRLRRRSFQSRQVFDADSRCPYRLTCSRISRRSREWSLRDRRRRDRRRRARRRVFDDSIFLGITVFPRNPRSIDRQSFSANRTIAANSPPIVGCDRTANSFAKNDSFRDIGCR